MLRNIFLITLSVFVMASAAGSNPKHNERGGDGSRGKEVTGTITSHNEHSNYFVLDDKDTIYYNDRTIFNPHSEKMLLLRVGSKVKVKYMTHEGDKVAELVEKAPANRTNNEREKDTTKNKAADKDKDNDRDSGKGKGKDKDKERGKDRGAEPDTTPYPEHDGRGEGW